jgi:hypothetical protein
MDKQIKVAWLKALRSGRYKQGKYELVNSSGEYCCLGVLARVQGAKKKEITNYGLLSKEDAFDKVINLDKYAAGLSLKSQRTLAMKNDSGCLCFTEIADYIEKKYK